MLRLSLVLILLGVGSVAVYFFAFLHLIRVPSGSMANTILSGDELVVKKRAFGQINRGDLIVFGYSGDPSTRYLARVIGLPRETLEVRGTRIYVNGKELDEQRVTVKPDDAFASDKLEELSTEGAGAYRVFYVIRDGSYSDFPGGDYAVNEPFQIPDDQYFVLGDNRDNSQDSRYRGPISRTAIFGKPTMIFWSEDRNEEPRWDRLFTKLR